MDDEAIAEAFNENSPLIDLIADFITKRCGIKVLTLGLTFLDYTRALEEKTSRFEHVDPDITTAHFSKVIQSWGGHEVNPRLVSFNREISLGDVVARLEGMNLRPAVPTELMDLLIADSCGGLRFQAIQKIQALGAYWLKEESKDKLVPTLVHADVSAALPRIGLNVEIEMYGQEWSFLAFPK